MEEKRKLLYGETKRARQNANNKVRLVTDKLYITGQEVIPPSKGTQRGAPRRYTGHAANGPNKDSSICAIVRQQNQQNRTQNNQTQMQHDTTAARHYEPTNPI